MKNKDKDELKIPVFPPLGMPVDPFGPVTADPLGSYTGLPADVMETPVQDADDL